MSEPAIALVLDGVVAGLLVALALRLLTTRDLFEAIVLFVAYGLTLAMAWARLGAPDVALAEAALGAGVTGAILLNGYRRLAQRTRPAGPKGAPTAAAAFDDGSRDGPLSVRLLLAAGGAAAAGGLAFVLLTAEPRPPALPTLVGSRLGESGVSNPVTAVLLNFRAYDTLLEVAVLLAAMVAVWSLDRGPRRFGRDVREAGDREPVLHGLARLVVPVAGLTAVYLAWTGSRAPGGAFQAGALLGGAGVLLTAAGLLRPPTAGAAFTRAAVACGLVVFVGVGVAVMPWTGTFLQYPPGWAYTSILAIEAVLTLSIAVVLVELFVDVTAVPEPDPSLARVDPTGDPLGRLLVPDEEPAERETGEPSP